MIATLHGEVAIEDLKIGDKVLTRDAGYRTVRWVGSRHFSQAELSDLKDLQPIRISAGSLGPAIPDRDLSVSPQHRMLLTSETTATGHETETLAAAVDLCWLPGIQPDDCQEVTYHHVLFDAHEIICANGSWSESFLPRAAEMNGLDDRQYYEILRIFPELATDDGSNRFRAARSFCQPTAHSTQDAKAA